MKSKLLISIFLVLILAGAYFYWTTTKPVNDNQVQPVEDTKQTTTDTNKIGMSNPASDNCTSKGNALEIVTESDGSQFGLCHFRNYACEEWTLFRNECDIEGDAQKIKEALIAKGLDLSNSTVVIKNHLGKYISGSVQPNDPVGGGGYVFAVKEEGVVKVLADGNGIILCSSLADYPDYPSYLVPECYDDAADTLVKR